MTLREAQDFVRKNSGDAGRVLGRWSKLQRQVWDEAWSVIGEEKKHLQHEEYLKYCERRRRRMEATRCTQQ